MNFLKTLLKYIRRALSGAGGVPYEGSRPKQKWPPDDLYHGGPYDDEWG
jgi:hypothetical protein